MTTPRDVLDALHPESRDVHAGRTVEVGHAEPTAPPLHMATAFTYPTNSEMDEVFADNSKGYVYSRMGNPTVRALEEAIAAIEGTDDAVAYGSGMAAIHGIVAALATAGTRIVASRDVYGATYAILRSHFSGLGIETTFADATDTGAFARLIADVRPALAIAEAIRTP
jgi:O-acetylhomoserine/O-acetylserine sulfhydrylase-like pyridoxal-dependent enzyme